MIWNLTVARKLELLGFMISKPLADLKEVTDRINKGDLTTAADINRRDEIGQLADSIN